MKLTLAALRAGFGEVNWETATELAAWDESRACKNACEAADEPNAGDILKHAEELTLERCDEYYDVSLVSRCGWLLTLAAADLLKVQAESILDDIHAAEKASRDAIETRLGEAVEAIDSALRDKCEVKCARGSNSIYMRYRGVSIRVSDHKQVSGGGWNEATGERYGECDCQWIINADSPLPTAEHVRKTISRILWDER